MSTILANRDIDTPGTLRALADEIEAENVGTLGVDFGREDDLDIDDPVAMQLTVTYALTDDQSTLPDVVHFLDENERVR